MRIPLLLSLRTDESAVCRRRLPSAREVAPL
jgi:hypothetical protein